VNKGLRSEKFVATGEGNVVRIDGWYASIVEDFEHVECTTVLDTSFENDVEGVGCGMQVKDLLAVINFDIIETTTFKLLEEQFFFGANARTKDSNAHR
jgi:hypothetical protein